MKGDLAATSTIVGVWTRTPQRRSPAAAPWNGKAASPSSAPSPTAWDRAHAAVASMGNRFPLIRMDSTEHRLASGRRAIANTGGETLMREELAEFVANVIDGIDPDTPADIDGSERILVAANLVTLARTAVEFDYRGDVVDAHAPEAPTRFAKQLTQVMRRHRYRAVTRIRVAPRDPSRPRSLPPIRLAIIDDLAKHPYSTPTDVRRHLGRPKARLVPEISIKGTCTQMDI